jgi:pimeloyl-ACP methyl ester carboxylesterase
MVALAPSWTREVEAVDQLGPNLSRYRDLLVPTLLLSGTLSSKYALQDATEALAATLKNVQLSRLEGQGHNAHSLAPTLVAERVAAFLLAQ